LTDALLTYAIERLRAARQLSSTPCKICGGDASLFDVLDFNKSCDSTLYPLGLSGIPVHYKRCHKCDFIFTDFFEGFAPEQWKRYVYNDDYIKVDPEYISIRPPRVAREIMAVLGDKKNSIIGLDYGGGNGFTTSLLRKDGWAFDSYDPFGHTDISPDRIGRYNFCSAMEVFEHLPSLFQLKDEPEGSEG
jgi:pimeloyl-ACP methyl ester carboxylesterase